MARHDAGTQSGGSVANARGCLLAGQKIVDASASFPSARQPFAEVRSQKPRSTGDQDTVGDKGHNTQCPYVVLGEASSQIDVDGGLQLDSNSVGGMKGFGYPA